MINILSNLNLQIVTKVQFHRRTTSVRSEKIMKLTLMISLLAASMPRGGDSFKLGRCEHDEMVDSVVKTLDCEMGIVKNVLNRGLLTKLELKEV